MQETKLGWILYWVKFKPKMYITNIYLILTMCQALFQVLYKF